MTTGKTITLTRQTFVGKVMNLLFNMLSRLVITFLPRSKCLLISWPQTPSAGILEPKKIKSATVSTVLDVVGVNYDLDVLGGNQLLIGHSSDGQTEHHIRPLQSFSPHPHIYVSESSSRSSTSAFWNLLWLIGHHSQVHPFLPHHLCSWRGPRKRQDSLNSVTSARDTFVPSLSISCHPCPQSWQPLIFSV